MRPSIWGYWVLGFSLLLAAAPVLAHHSFGKEYDLKKPITLKGVVTRVDWVNPHISFWVDVTDDRGQVTQWGFESASPSVLAMRGWTRGVLKQGDQITVEGFQARDGKPFATTRSVTLADGRKMQANADGVPR